MRRQTSHRPLRNVRRVQSRLPSLTSHIRPLVLGRSNSASRNNLRSRVRSRNSDKARGRAPAAPSLRTAGTSFHRRNMAHRQKRLHLPADSDQQQKRYVSQPRRSSTRWLFTEAKVRHFFLALTPTCLVFFFNFLASILILNKLPSS